MCHSRGDIVLVTALAVTLGLPCVSRAQSAREDFVRAVGSLRVAMQGAYGDEGQELLQRLDDVSRALAAWDRSIVAEEARLQPRLASAAGGQGADLRVELGLLYLERSWFGDALTEFDAATQLAPERGAVHLLRGIALERLGRGDDARAAYFDAWTRDPSDPVKAYLALTRSAAVSISNQAGLAAVSDSLVTASRDILRRARMRSGAAFLDVQFRTDAADSAVVFPLARYAEGFALYRSGRYEEAIASWRVAAAADPLVTDTTSSLPRMAAGLAAFRQGRLAEAIGAMREHVTTRGASSEAHRILGTALAVAGRKAESVAQLDAALRARPDDERSWIALAHGGGAGAENVVRRLDAAVKAVPDSGELHWRLAASLVTLERNGEALEHYAHAARLGAVAGQGQVDQFEALLATMHLDADRTAAAFERRVRGNPNDASAHRDLAGVYAKQGRQAESFAELVIAAWIDPTDPQTLVGLGHAHLAARRDADAVEAFQEAVRIAPDMREARYAFAQALTRAGRRDEGVRQLSAFERLRRDAAERARRDDALDALKAAARGHSRGGRHQLAVQAWTQIVQTEPAMSQNHIDLAEAMVAAGQLAESVEHFVKAAESDGVSDVHLRLSEVLGRLGRERESALARETYERLQLEDFRRRLTTP